MPEVARGRVLLGGTFFLPRSGTRAVSQGLAVQLQERGWEVVTTSAIQNKALRLLDMPLTAARHRNHYDVAHVDVFGGLGFLWAEATCLAVALARRPYLLTLRGGQLRDFSQLHSIRFARLLRGAHRVFAPSSFFQREFAHIRSDIDLLPNPIEIGAYHMRKRAPARPRLVWLRAFADKYNPEMAVRAVARLAHRFHGIQLDIVGPLRHPNTVGSVRRLIRELRVEDRVHLRGPVPKEQVPEVISRADIFLNTSRVDNMPVTVLEAMASGLGVVSTNVGGMTAMLTHEKNALLVEDNDSDGMADAIARLLDEPALYERITLAARGRAEAHDWDVLLPRWERAFHEAQETAASSRRRFRIREVEPDG